MISLLVELGIESENSMLILFAFLALFLTLFAHFVDFLL